MTGRQVEPLPVNAKVTAEVGTVYAHLLSPVTVRNEPDDAVTLPWAWSAVCHVKFRIGKAQVTKRITAKHVFTDRYVMTEDDRDAGKLAVLDEVRRHLRRHGIDPLPLVVEVSV